MSKQTETEKDFNYWIGVPEWGGETVSTKELRPFLTILKTKYINALWEVQRLSAEKSRLAERNTFLEDENLKLKNLNEELTQENNSLTEQIYG